MNRIDQIFSELRTQGRRTLMPFITAGFPSLDATARIIKAAEAAGAGICEIGIPFSDPVADGPVIAASMTDALAKNISIDDIFQMVSELRPQVNLGLIAMVSYSIPYRMGVEQFIKRAAEAGFDGFIFPDLPLEEAPAVSKAVKEAGLISALLIAPTTGDDRAAKIAACSSGFVYVIARTGITGERAELPPELAARLERLRTVTDLPIAVGFGVSTAAHVRTITAVADAAIVGSALISVIDKHRDESPEQIAAATEQFVAELATGLASGVSAG